MIASAVNMIVQQSRLDDGTRKVLYVTEIGGIKGDVVTLQDIFVYQQDGIGIQNSETALYYCGAKLVLDLNRLSLNWTGRDRIEKRGSVGPRIYEAAACGSAIVAQGPAPEMYDLLGNNFLSFDTPDELSDIVRDWTRDERAHDRNEMGAAAHQAMHGHSYTDRALELLRVASGT